MKIIALENWPRRQHFDRFMQMDMPHYHICADVEVGRLLTFCQQNQHSFFIACAYSIALAANSVDALRMRIRDEKVVLHEVINPSFTVPSTDGLFSYCYTQLSEDFTRYQRDSRERIATASRQINLQEPVGSDNFYYMSCLPWVRFTSLSHAMNLDTRDAVPRISWGKYQKQADKVVMPVQIQVHHALVDGIHLGQVYQQLQQILDSPEKL